MKLEEKVVPILVALLLISFFLLALTMVIPKAECGGSDTQGMELVKQSLKYEPWMHYVWEPPSGEIEALLFALQATIGSLIIGYYFVVLKGSSEPMLTFSVIGMQLTIMREGLKLGTLLTMKSIAGISCLLFLAMTTPIAEILNTMKKLWMPEILVELSFMIYKLIFELFDEIERTKKAQDARLGYLRGNRIKSLALLVSSILVNSLKGAEKKEKALEARCYAGRIPSLDLGKSKNKGRMICVTSSFILMFSFDIFLLVMVMIMENRMIT